MDAVIRVFGTPGVRGSPTGWFKGLGGVRCAQGKARKTSEVEGKRLRRWGPWAVVEATRCWFCVSGSRGERRPRRLLSGTCSWCTRGTVRQLRPAVHFPSSTSTTSSLAGCGRDHGRWSESARDEKSSALPFASLALSTFRSFSTHETTRSTSRWRKVTKNKAVWSHAPGLDPGVFGRFGRRVVGKVFVKAKHRRVQPVPYKWGL